VEILQNCNIYNDGAFDSVREEEEHRLYLEDGQSVPELGFVHEERAENPSQAFALARMSVETDGRLPLGVFRAVEQPVYDELMAEQIDRAVEERGKGDLAALLHAGDTWTI
jgi:2-oxoglutarate ferredoxin oxidoreductase subunit beta